MGKFYNAIMGLVVGDALGVPFEFRKRDTFKATGMTGYGTYNQPIGTWSDDSSMTLATIESLTRTGKIDLKDIMQNFCYWLMYGYFTPYGNTFDVGITTRQAISRFFYHKIEAGMCGGTSMMDNGNGSLMRILPLAFVPNGADSVENVSALTHAHGISQLACKTYTLIAQMLIKGEITPKDMGRIVVMGENAEHFSRLKQLYALSRDEIKSSGYVVDSLEAALWCLTHTESYEECVLAAVNLGEDTDTIAAIAGGLAGIYYGVGGEKGIPEEWIEQIARHDWIKMLCDDFENKFCLQGDKK